MKLKWDQIGERKYKTGVDHVVLYPTVDGVYPAGYVWNGVTNITESPSGAEDSSMYADNMKYLSIKSAEELGLTIECYMYPDEWEACNGETVIADGVKLGQQRRTRFGLSYRTKLGNDTENEDYGFELHLIYNCSASPSEQSNATINDSPEPATFSYELTTTPLTVSGVGPDGKPYKPVASITIDSTKVDQEKLAELEAILYGTDDPDTEGRLPLPDEIKDMFLNTSSSTTGSDSTTTESDGGIAEGTN